jgi:Protein of unknown function (DUF2846)
MRRFLAIPVATILLAGCAATGPLGTEVLNVSTKPNMARMVIYRTSAFGFAIQPDYVIDGKAVAASQPGGFIACDVPPGRHEIAVGNIAISNNLFGGGSEKITVDLRAGSMAYFAAAPQMGLVAGQITLTNVTEVQGRADIAGLHQIPGACNGPAVAGNRT